MVRICSVFRSTRVCVDMVRRQDFRHPPLRESTCCLLLRDKSKLNRRPMHEYQCDKRLKSKAEGSTRLSYTGLCGGLEHLKIETRLIDERFPSVMVRVWFRSYRSLLGDPSIFKLIRKTVVLVRMLPTFDLSCEENAARRKWKSPLVGAKKKWSVSDDLEKCCLLWIDKTRAKDKIYIWVSVWWKTTN
jgi:hypothetical protein